MPDALVSLNQTYLGKEMANVIGFSNVQEDATWLQTFADDIRSDYTQHVPSAFSDQWFLNNISVSFLSSTAVLYSVDVAFTLGPLQGGNANDPLPTQTALLISTNHLGPRPNRGRTYFSGLTENAIQNGVYFAATVGLFEDLVTDWVEGAGPAGQLAFMRIIRRPSAVFPAYVTNPIDLVVGDTIPATQRRRRLAE